MLRKTAVAALAIMMVGALTLQADFTDEQLAAWQATAETFYVQGIDENFMLPLMDDPTLQPNRWGFDNQDLIQPGMIAPDFTLFDVYDEPFTLSQFEGNNFVFLITGSWY